MAIYNVHAGHNFHVPGASGVFSETVEDRKVKERVIAMLRELGHTVYDCTDEDGRTQGKNLSNIVAKCNAHTVNLDISIHFNASGGSGNGVEVLCYDTGTKDVAAAICRKIADLGFRNRGVKYQQDLYVLKNTKASAILIECCFCDSVLDAGKYNAEDMAKAIVGGITGETAGSEPKQDAKPAAKKPMSADPDIHVDYAVMIAGGKILPFVRDMNDYAGIIGRSIVGLIIKCSKGYCKYRVHLKGKRWLPYVYSKNADWNDAVNGWAGDGKTPIDAIEVYYYTPDDVRPYKRAKYRVSALGRNYYSWQYDNETGSGQDGYAGAFGRAIDRFQLVIE